RRRGGRRKFNDHNSRVLVWRVAAHVRKIESARNDGKLLGLRVGCDVLVGCSAQTDVADVGRLVAARLNQRRRAARHGSINQKMHEGLSYRYGTLVCLFHQLGGEGESRSNV